MRRVTTLAIALILAGCDQAAVGAIDTSDDLHCSIVVQTVEMNMDKNAAGLAKKGIFALRTWYYSKVPEDRLREGAAVTEFLKHNSEKIPQFAQECTKRAFEDPQFDQWSTFAAKEYDQNESSMVRP